MVTATILTEVTSALTQVIAWLGSVITALTSSEGALSPLLPILAVAVAVSVIMLTCKVIKKFCWGA